eukprot:gene14496-22192_t
MATACAASGPIVLIHDAGIDDYMCSVLLSSFPGRFIGEVIVNADSTVPESMIGASKLQKVLQAARGLSSVALSLSRTRMYNAFPWEYREDAHKFINLPELAGVESNVSWPFADGEAWLKNVLRTRTDITIVLVSASSPLTEILLTDPSLMGSISQILWMAGAMRVPGNLDPVQFPWNNTRAEWNVFTDPFSASSLLAAAASNPATQLIFFPLDISDQTPLNQQFYDLLQEAVVRSVPGTPQHLLHKVVLSAYELVRTQPYYRLWDTVAAGYLLWPELYGELVVESYNLSTTTANMGGFQPCGTPGREGCYNLSYFANFASDEARQQFIRNVAKS